MKSKASYTNKWMHHYPSFWHEEEIKTGCKIIVVDKVDAPQIVKERVQEINNRRYEKKAQFYFIRGYSLNVFIRACKIKDGLKKCSIDLFIRILNDERRIERIVNKYGCACVHPKNYDEES